MKKILVFILLLPFLGKSQYDPEQEYWKNNKSMPYEKVIAFYQNMADQDDRIQILKKGTTDAGFPLHFVLVNGDSTDIYDPNKTKIFINNGIHPGEPCGVDASIQMVYDFHKGKREIPEDVLLGIVPLYNVGGALRRNCCTRANQNGPEAYGFRGNAKNLDLNRDFIKMDSKNAFAFVSAFHFFKPHLLIDTHTSNGADYTYTMTYLPQLTATLNPELREIQQGMNTFLFSAMKEDEATMIPYVYNMKQTPFDGIQAYYDSPRYTTGYASLFNTLGFTSEAHMLKTFPERVEATYKLIKHLIVFADENGTLLKNAQHKAFEVDQKLNSVAWDYQLDTTHYETIPFKGYRAIYYESPVTGKKAYRYDNKDIVDTTIQYFNSYKASEEIKIPEYFIIKRGFESVKQRLLANNIDMITADQDTVVNVTVTKTFPEPEKARLYEGHFYHTEIKTLRYNTNVTLHPHDLIIPVTEENKRFLTHVLIPEMKDSYWRWNFFDATLQQKEYFSAYVFEETVNKMLAKDPELQKKWNNYKSKIDIEKTSHWEMLYFLYKQSENYEETDFEYPVYMVY